LNKPAVLIGHDPTLVDILARRAACQADDVVYTFVGKDADADIRLTYRDLFEEAAGLAAVLQEHGLTGERVLLGLKSNACFVVSFFACLMAGAVAVPTAPSRRDQMAHRMRTIAGNAAARAGILDSSEAMPAASGSGPDGMQWFDIRQLRQGLRARVGDWRPPKLKADSLAFLQYTSGSTGEPKGVMIGHGNLMANSRDIAEAFGHGPDARGLVALPLYHDMGLIGGALQPVYAGFPVHLMTPSQFVHKPQRWLQIISQQRISTSGGPNFMYDLAAQSARDEHLEGLDLSCWRVAFCGAEPIRAATIERFRRAFAPYGFRDGAFLACYGLAEATLFVTGHELSRPPRIDADVPGGQPVVGCGRTRSGARVEIVDPATRQTLPDGVEGEIWVSGASVARGYWQNPVATAQSFGARLAGADAASFLRTGDLGYQKGGELFVTGRLNDLIIVRGRNYAPHDLEVEAERSHPGLQPGGGAAFTLTEGDHERLILALELKREWRRRTEAWDDIKAAVRVAVARGYQLRIDDIVLLPPGALPRTSSGKVRRAQCRADYRQGKLLPVAPVAAGPETALAATVALDLLMGQDA
jgi:acyl-CoA synthetase (AMP-forming)/AMP-acid ligase II